jgi:hypothetical protein
MTLSRQSVLVKIWNICYPILIYYMVSNITMYLLILALGITDETYTGSYMMLQTLATVVCIPFLFHFYHRDRMLCTVYQQRLAQGRAETSWGQKCFHGLLSFVAGALGGMALNQIISATGLLQVSEGYQTATAHFYGGGLFFEVLGVGILIPIAEELLYRGIVMGRLWDWIGAPAALVWSALIFGGLHMNLVQFLYAGLLGALLGLLVQRTRSLTAGIAAHLGANLFTLLRVESGAFDWLGSGGALYWVVAVVLLLISGGLTAVVCWRNK